MSFYEDLTILVIVRHKHLKMLGESVSINVHVIISTKFKGHTEQQSTCKCIQSLLFLQVEADSGIGKRTKEEAGEKLRVLKLHREDDYKQSVVTSRMNFVSMFLVFAITVTNMFITGFGIKLESSTSVPFQFSINFEKKNSTHI